MSTLNSSHGLSNRPSNTLINPYNKAQVWSRAHNLIGQEAPTRHMLGPSSKKLDNLPQVEMYRLMQPATTWPSIDRMGSNKFH
ncbi:Vegetative incompatibility protein HET-E-1 [Fusarium oxysporum f. sp. albedinis]|nr:Vegetative incompatibility protein HET-E-1 [Fusarium oxysporum f. sp. albedinis]